MTSDEFRELVWAYGEAMNDRWEDEATRKRLENELVDEYTKLLEAMGDIYKICWKRFNND